jgi:hypothetical protein
MGLYTDCMREHTLTERVDPGDIDAPDPRRPSECPNSIYRIAGDGCHPRAIRDPGSIWISLLVGLLIFGVMIVPWIATFRYPEDERRQHRSGHG